MDVLKKEYAELLGQQQFNESELDYTILEKHKTLLQQLSVVGNIGITVFDLFRKKHVFTSYNFENLFGYDLKEVENAGTEYFNSRVHPDDFIVLSQNGIELMKFVYQLPKESRTAYKLINEYRILNGEEKYIRVIEQHQVLELDVNGNIWLALSVVDVSPNQEVFSEIKSQLLNYKTGKIVTLIQDDATKENVLVNDLTKREKEILQMVKEGFLSKEISDKLSISIHTVNTHRQRILEKLNVDNSMEAVGYASKLGLLK